MTGHNGALVRFVFYHICGSVRHRKRSENILTVLRYENKESIGVSETLLFHVASPGGLEAEYLTHRM